jgi:hypothetical protein
MLDDDGIKLAILCVFYIPCVLYLVQLILVLCLGDFNPFRGIHPFTEAGRPRTQESVRERRRRQRRTERDLQERLEARRRRDKVTASNSGMKKLDESLEDFDGDILDETVKFGSDIRIARLELHLQKLEETVGHVSPKSARKRG